MKKTLLVLLILSAGLHAFAQNRSYINLQNDWKFAKGEITHAEKVSFNDSDWQTVRIPHDWAINEPFITNGDGDTGKLPWKGVGWYRYELELPKGAENKRIYIIFDGVMAFPEVYLNGDLVGKWDYGYNSFYFDITDFISFSGKNLLAVKADTHQHDSRWYPGAGIYRKVQLLLVDPVHVDVWGTYVHTPVIKPHYADVRAKATINNTTDKNVLVLVKHSVINPQGIEVGSDTISRVVYAKRQHDFERTIKISNPQYWDTEHPHLYRLVSQILVEGGEPADEISTAFGIRSAHFTADDGFYLNGKRVQLKGVNLHHDHGPLGAAFHPRAMERQLEIMKAMGVNAIRNSHNVAAPELLEMCDRMGLLLFNEIFDRYDAKAGILDTTHFDNFARRNITNFAKRDRNHPSVILWSVGNEIADVQWNINNGFERLHTMVNYLRKYDAFRPVTLVNDSWKSAELRHFDYYDVHAWNYDRRYRLARQMEPGKSVVISESASTVSTRGFYEFPLPEDKTDFTHSLQVSSYDLHAPEWAEIADDDFMWQQDEAYIAGEFVWTGFDYLGEPTPYTNKKVKELGFTDHEASRSSYFGIVDLVGLPKDRYYLYKSYWKPEEDLIHILPHWNWPDRVGQNVPVFVYTNGDCAELFLNGRSLGRRCKKPDSKNSTERFRLMWDEVTYERGELKVVVYKDRQKLGEKSLKTTGEAEALTATVDRKRIKSDGLDLAYITIEAIDKAGMPHPLAGNRVKVELKGKAEIAGLGNGNPQSFEPFRADYVDLFYGKAVVIIKGYEPGNNKITFSADGLKKTSIDIILE